MTQSTAPALARGDLLRGLNACDARVYRFIAGAGFGKSTLAWELAGARGPVSLCDMLGARNATDVWRRLITAISKISATEGQHIAKESLTLAIAQQSERDAYLRTVAQRAALSGTLLVENAENLSDDASLSPLQALLAGHPSCAIVICSRRDLHLGIARHYAPHEFVTVRERDLRFRLADVRQLLDPGAPDSQAERALAWSAGWPLAAVRAAALLRRGDDLPESAAAESWLHQLTGETMASLRPAFYDAVLRLAAIAEPAEDEVFASVPSEERGHARRDLLDAVPFLSERPDGSLELHALAREALLKSFTAQCAHARDAVFAEASARCDHLRCAELALQRDDPQAAADALVRADHDFYRMPSSRYVAVLERLERDAVLARPALWMVSEICLKSDFLELNRELEPVLRERAELLSPRTRMACAALVCFRRGEYDGRWEEGSALLDEFENSFARDCERPKDLLYAAMYRCGAASNEGRDFDGAAYWSEYGGELVQAPIFYGESLYWEATRAYFRNDPESALDATARYVEQVRECGYPVYRRASLYRALFLCWELRARELFEPYRSELTGLLTAPAAPNDLLARLAWEVLDATSGVPPYRDGPIVSTGCVTNLMLASEADDYDVVESAMNQALSMSGNPALRVANLKLSVAAFCFDPNEHERLLDGAFATFGEDAAPDLRACVERLRAGENAGILEPIAARFRAAGERHRNALFVDVTLGRVRRGGAEVRLGDRELELLALLAAAGRPLPALDLAELLWPHSDDAAARNALKVCISRIRARTGCKEAIVAAGGDVSLSAAHVHTDLDRAQRLLRLAQDGSSAAAHAARAILERPVPQRYASWGTRASVTARWQSLKLAL